MILRTCDLRFVVKASCILLCLTIISITAQAAQDNPPAQSPPQSLPTPQTNQTEESSKTTAAARPPAAMPAAKDSSTAENPAPAPVAPVEAATKPAPQSSSDKWQFQFTPYLFMASISGEVGARGQAAEVDSRFRDLVKDLNLGLTGAFEARKNKVMILVDTQYLHLSDEQDLGGLLFSSVKADAKLFIFDPEVGYRVAESDKASLDVLAGIRYWHVKLNLDFRPGVLNPGTEVEGSKNWVDAVGGLRFKADLSERWFVTGKLDLGGGGSDFTWQIFGGAGVRFGDHVSLIGGYRYLKVDYDDDSGFLFDVAMKGPIVGVGFRF